MHFNSSEHVERNQQNQGNNKANVYCFIVVSHAFFLVDSVQQVLALLHVLFNVLEQYVVSGIDALRSDGVISVVYKASTAVLYFILNFFGVVVIRHEINAPAWRVIVCIVIVRYEMLSYAFGNVRGYIENTQDEVLERLHRDYVV